MPTLDSELKALRYSYNRAKSKMSFDAAYRKFGPMCEFFGIHLDKKDERYGKSVFIKELNQFRDELDSRIRTKYSSEKIPNSGVSKIQSKETENRATIRGQGSPEELRNSVERLLAEPLNPLLPDIRRNILSFNPFQQEQTLYYDFTLDCSYNPKFHDQEATLLVDEANQVKAARTLWFRYEKLDHKMQLLLAGTGAGKTYILASFIKNFIESGQLKKLGSISPWPVLYVTKATIVDQTRKVLYDEFNISPELVHVVNIELLRSQLGSMFISEETVVVDGVARKVHKWNPYMHPALFIWDECQILAREDAEQTKIALAVSRIEDDYPLAKVYQIDASATPFSRIAEGKQFAIGTRKQITLGMSEETLSVKNWSAYAGSLITDCGDPECKGTIYTYCAPSVKNFTDQFEDYIVRIKGIKPKFKTINKVMKIRFYTAAEREEYEQAWIKYQEKKAKLEGEAGADNAMAILAQFTIFRKAAEKIRRYHLAKFAYESWNKGKAPAIACAFKGTIVATYKILVEDYGWTRDDVSIVWGGSTESLSIKQKIAKASKKSKEFNDALKAAGVDLEELGIDTDIEIKTDEELAFEKAHNLLTQKPEDRERERMRFQTQKSKLLFFTYKAGGAGMSAHHEAKYPNARPREGIFSSVYSEKEFIQALGRLGRITSISETLQLIAYYAGTIEEHVINRVVIKLLCAQQVSQGGESWEDVIVGKQNVDTNKNEELIMNVVDELEGRNLLGEFGGEQEEE